MDADLDDTVVTVALPWPIPGGVDLDDTVIVPRAEPERAVPKRAEPERVAQPGAVPVVTPDATDAPARSAAPAGAALVGGALAAAASPDAPVPAAPSPVIPAHVHLVRVGTEPEPLPLDAPVVIGRRPRPPRIATGPAPRLVTVASASREVSGTHLEVRQLGESVIVTDLRSTNGSLVSVPGAAVRKLRQGESVVVTAGTVVDIGDGILVEILPRRLVPGR